MVKLKLNASSVSDLHSLWQHRRTSMYQKKDKKKNERKNKEKENSKEKEKEKGEATLWFMRDEGK